MVEQDQIANEIIYESEESSIAEYERYNPTRRVIESQDGNKPIQLVSVTEGNENCKYLIVGSISIPIDAQNEDEINKKIVEEVLPKEMLLPFVSNSIHLSHLVRHAINNKNLGPQEFLVLTGILR